MNTKSSPNGVSTSSIKHGRLVNPRHSAIRLVLVSLVAWLFVVACQTEQNEPPLAAVGQALPGPPRVIPGVDNRGCGVGEPLGCPSGETWTCDGVCVPALEDGDTCTLAQCDDVCVTASGAPNSASCVKEGTQWVCRDADQTDPLAAGLGWLFPCDPSTGTTKPCPTNMWCQYIADATTRARYQEDWGTNYMCNFTAQQDWRCGTAGDPPCHAGYDCRDGRCRRECQADNDCPCDLDGNQDYSCVEGNCRFCADTLGDACGSGTTFGTLCCDEKLTCGADGKCCIQRDEECAADEECCQHDEESCINGKCGRCIELNNSGCDTDADCCDGRTCDDGKCINECVPNQACDTGLDGVCAAGTTTCQGGMAVCTGTMPSAETCDGLDNDCDGEVDEGISQPDCTATNIVGCQSGFTATGKMKCIGGTSTCIAEPDEAFCNGCNQDVNGQSCGTCANTPNACLADSDCTPNSVCNQTTLECVYEPLCGPNNGICWMPSDNGKCNYP